MTHSDSQNSLAPLKVFYDGNCIVCSREVRFYAARSDDLVLIDISHPDFEAAAYGKALDQFMAELHVLDNCGSWHVGVGAFRVIWMVVPGRLYGGLAEVIDWPLVRPLADVGYQIFARYRVYLPQYRRLCKDDTCRHARN